MKVLIQRFFAVMLFVVSGLIVNLTLSETAIAQCQYPQCSQKPEKEKKFKLVKLPPSGEVLTGFFGRVVIEVSDRETEQEQEEEAPPASGEELTNQETRRALENALRVLAELQRALNPAPEGASVPQPAPMPEAVEEQTPAPPTEDASINHALLIEVQRLAQQVDSLDRRISALQVETQRN